MRDAQRLFAFAWDIDADGHEDKEIDLAKKYVEEFGVRTLRPVLITSNYSIETAGYDLELVPLGVWFPEVILPDVYFEGRVDTDALEEINEYGCITDSAAFAPVLLGPNDIVSADTPLSALFEPSCGASMPLLVCDGMKWSGVLGSRELFSTPAQICLFALVRELEEVAGSLCKTFAVQCFKSLAPGRQEKAVKEFRTQYEAIDSAKTPNKLLSAVKRRGLQVVNGQPGGGLSAMLVDCTAFADKKEMLRKCKLLIDYSKAELKRLFENAEKIRNFCAHTGNDATGFPFSLTELRQTVADIQRGIAAIREADDREWRVHRRTEPSKSGD